ncbi:citramalyl-CoA lyase, mitochondrial-like isoform X1 [Sitophilus oryzae]|uniref:Citramalyl-CoA lyase, mitochondrial n=2 Tax=Sitophilus oryzae TaxID=7048 RepID=A0A6J2YI49_SITOR|nr:citramalyl-CoA lyase, mitochondrial-like isoform X1 [Sitophilus oryzae]
MLVSFVKFRTIPRFLNINKIIVRKYNVPRRALMYVPGDDPKKISKSLTLDVDCIALDCEDGVAVNKKREARETIRSFLDKGKPSKDRDYDFGVRINAFDTEYWQEDLESCLTAINLPDTILIPKVETADTIKQFSEEVKQRIKSDKKINVIIYIESARAFLNIVDICKTAEGLSKTSNIQPVSLVFGSDDFCANIGATRTESSIEILYARQKLVLVAKAFNLQAIDMVYIKYKDLEGLKKQCEEGMKMGYTGKQVIHPGQVPIVQEAFLPSASQIEWASGLLQSFEKHQKDGKGAFTYKGSMIDMPTMRQAENVIKLANLKKT